MARWGSPCAALAASYLLSHICCAAVGPAVHTSCSARKVCGAMVMPQPKLTLLCTPAASRRRACMTTWSITTAWTRPLRSSIRLQTGRLRARPALGLWQMPQPSRWDRHHGSAPSYAAVSSRSCARFGTCMPQQRADAVQLPLLLRSYVAGTLKPFMLCASQQSQGQPQPAGQPAQAEPQADSKPASSAATQATPPQQDGEAASHTDAAPPPGGSSNRETDAQPSQPSPAAAAPTAAAGLERWKGKVALVTGAP
jgi:hypothetical protein